MNKRCVVNVATGEFYCKMQERLVKSFYRFDKPQDADMLRFADGQQIYTSWLHRFDLITWRNELPSGSLRHEQSPYGFKAHAIKAAYEMGYTSVLWLDSPAYEIKEDLSPIFEKIEKEGYYAMSHCDPLENWVGDTALTVYQWPREKLMGHNLPSGSCYGFRVDGPMPDAMEQKKELFWDFYFQEQDGLFRSEVIGEGKWHRHDEAILALCLIDRGLPIFTFDPLFQSDHPECLIKSGG
jgi:hypothetical protein